MWYVNSKGAKFSTYAYTCFILTMWYVNTLSNHIILSENPSFILTMWYVNNNRTYTKY